MKYESEKNETEELRAKLKQKNTDYCALRDEKSHLEVAYNRAKLNSDTLERQYNEMV